MTVIEFYDRTSIENIFGVLLLKPERMILVGSDAALLKKCTRSYKNVLRLRGIPTEVSYICINKDYLKNTVNTLETIVKNDDRCIFDLTGGEELHHVAVGVLMERYGEKVECLRFNIINEAVIDCASKNCYSVHRPIDISVEEDILIYGGKMQKDKKLEHYTYPWSYTADFILDVQKMWDLCKSNPKLWNASIGTIGAIFEHIGLNNNLTLSFNEERARVLLLENKVNYSLTESFLQILSNKGLITSLSYDQKISFSFKNEQVMRCLTIAGQVLELIIAIRMMRLKDRHGAPLYNDVKVGVVMDWSLDDSDVMPETINEIDIMAMRGTIPIFVSCKNGFFDANELYKLNTVAEKFGDKYAKKVLIATGIKRMGIKGEYLISRMKDMNIKCIHNPGAISEKDLDAILGSLWINE